VIEHCSVPIGADELSRELNGEAQTRIGRRLLDTGG
jgi:hypothetical protein